MYQKFRYAVNRKLCRRYKNPASCGDPNRLRILLLLKSEELSVAELQEILAMGRAPSRRTCRN